jgi:hypothetical protein
VIASRLHRFSPAMGVASFVLGIVLAVMSCGLLAMHARSFALKRDTAVMIGTTLPELRSRTALLAAEREAERVFARTALSAREEQASVYVLPDRPSAERTITVLSALADAVSFGSSRASVLSTLFDESARDRKGYRTVGMHLRIASDIPALIRFLAVLSYSGDMMVRDTLSPDAIKDLLRSVESKSPLALKAAQDFLYGDLPSSIAAADTAENFLPKDLPENANADIRAILARSGWAMARSILAPSITALRNPSVWPLPLTTVDRIVRDRDAWKVDLTLYRR